MNQMRALRGLVACAAATVAAAAAAQDPTQTANDVRPVSLSFGTGIEYDSNVAVLELDTSTDAGDRSLLFDFGVGYDKPDSGRFDVQAGYDFSQSLHDDFDSFDVRIHRGSGTLSYDLGRVDLGATLQHAYAELDGNEFLTLQQISPYVSKLVGRRLFLRFAYAHSDKDFAGNPTRSANADALSADAYVFIDGLRTYLVFGFRVDDENAIDSQFDYAGDMLRAQLAKRLMAGERELTLRTSLRFENRDYDSPTLSIGNPRHDDRRQLELSLDVPLGQRTTAQVVYEHADNRSNLPSVDFAENVLSLKFRARL
jgi:opacity protein-like surface antigen